MKISLLTETIYIFNILYISLFISFNILSILIFSHMLHGSVTLWTQ